VVRRTVIKNTHLLTRRNVRNINTSFRVSCYIRANNLVIVESNAEV
jgi:hypothetical protein